MYIFKSDMKYRGPWYIYKQNLKYYINNDYSIG